MVPVKSKLIDWSNVFPYTNTKDKDTTSKLLALGWGDKGFYLNTPTWDDLTFSTAFKAMFGLSTSALHTTYLDSIHVSSTCKKIPMTQNEYALLVRYIQRTISASKKGRISSRYDSTSIVQYDLQENFIKEWEDRVELKEFGFRVADISEVCRGLQKTAFGFKWKFKQ